MSDIKMSDENVIYCLNYLSEFDAKDIDDDEFDIAVNDDQFTSMSIVRTVKLGAELAEKLTEQNKILKEALHLVSDKIPVYQNIQGGGYAITLNVDDVNIIKETLSIIELK